MSMSYNRSTPAQTLARIEAETRIELPGSNPQLRFSPERVNARIVAAASYELDGHIDYKSRQMFVSTCDVEYLPLHARDWRVPRNLASASTGQVQFAGSDDAVITAGTILTRSDGQEYTLAEEVTISGGVGVGTVNATEAGAAGNAAAASSLTLSSPVPYVQSVVTVLAPGLSGGVDIENPESWRARILARKQKVAQGGNDDDYERWCKEVSGVTRVWVHPHQLGLGSVYLLFVMDEKEGTIIPTPAEVATAQAHIDEVRPTTADVVVAAPTPVAVNFVINLSPNNAAVRAAVTAELQDLVRRESTPGGTVTNPGGTLLLSRIREAISVAAGEEDHELVSPSANVVRAFGEISVIGSITFGSMA